MLKPNFEKADGLGISFRARLEVMYIYVEVSSSYWRGAQRGML